MNIFTSSLAALALMAPSQVGSPATTPVVQVASAQVKALVQSLDDDRFGVRENADKELRKLGVAALPALRQELQGELSLEARQRVTAILREMTTIHWQGDLRSALQQARESRKPLLVFATAGLPSLPRSVGSAAMQQRTFNDQELVNYLNANFVTVWHDSVPGEIHAMEAMNGGQQGFNREQVNSLGEGTGPGTHTFLCSPEGKVLKHLEGFFSAARVVKEAEQARELVKNPNASLPPTESQALAQANVQVVFKASGQPVQQQMAESRHHLAGAKLGNAVGKHISDVVVELDRTARRLMFRGC